MDEKQRILIVDDERLNINVLNDLLKNEYKIMAAISGKQALKAAFSETPPDLILLDVMMPEMNGYEVCKELKANEKTQNIPIIFVTAMNSENDETKGFQAGAVDYITKPISAATVEARVKTHLTLTQKMSQLNIAYQTINKQKQIMTKELDVAKNIQLSMLPHIFPDNPNFVLNALMVAAKEIGGDFYDFFFIDKDHLSICIGDVSGKGVPAALFMAVTKSLIKSRSVDDMSPGSILTHVNSELSINNDSCMFVTVFLLILNIQTGECKYSNAGHNPPFIKKNDKHIERLSKRHGVVLGAIAGSTYNESSITLDFNDTLILYTDGVTEAMDIKSSLFGENKLIDVINNYKEPADIVSNIFSEVKGFENGVEQTDDITAMVLKFLGEKRELKNIELNIKILNIIDDIKNVEDKFDTFADANGITISNSARIKTVLDEVLNNIIFYGYIDSEKHFIHLSFVLFEKRLTITITDDGIPFNPFTNKEPNTTLSVNERNIGGLGIHIVKNIMDEVLYRRKIDKNQITLIMNLK